MRYVTTQTGFYTDPDLSDWSRDALWLYRYLYENDHAHGITGVGRISKAVMLAESRMTDAEFAAAKREIGARVQWFSDGTYWVIGRIKHTCFTSGGRPSPKHVAALANFIGTASHELRDAITARYPIDRVSMGYAALESEKPDASPATRVVPDELKDLPLYAEDRRLCQQWPQLYAAIRTANPGIDAMAEVRRAHAWEVAQPASARKKHRAKFLTAWIARASERAAKDAPKIEPPDPLSPSELAALEAEAEAHRTAEQKGLSPAECARMAADARERAGRVTTTEGAPCQN